MMSTERHAAECRILRRPEVEARCGFKRAHLYKLIGNGEFPSPIQIGVRAVGWDSREIDQWIRRKAATMDLRLLIAYTTVAISTAAQTVKFDTRRSGPCFDQRH